MKIKGLSKLTPEQQKHMKEIHKRHVACNGTDRQMSMAIAETWIDENQVVCVRMQNGEWYHYYPDGTWA